MVEKRNMYEKLKKEKSQELVMLLDLFDGKITLTELLNTDIPLIQQLRDAKIELIHQQNPNKANKYNNVKTVDPSTLKERMNKHD